MAKPQQDLTDGKRTWTPENPVEATNLRARGWKPVGQKPADKPETKADPGKNNK